MVMALLGWVPVLTSLVLGLLYLTMSDGAPAVKVIGSMVFLAAVYLQFFSASMTAGLLLQVALAFTLEIWRRLGNVSLPS
jgi:hypothetical protein